MAIEQLLFDISDALRTPVLVAALLVAGVRSSRQARWPRSCGDAAAAGCGGWSASSTACAPPWSRGAWPDLRPSTGRDSRPMHEALVAIVDLHADPTPARIAKRMAEYDYRSCAASSARGSSCGWAPRSA